jgi:hypothetical protein
MNARFPVDSRKTRPGRVPALAAGLLSVFFLAGPAISQSSMDTSAGPAPVSPAPAEDDAMSPFLQDLDSSMGGSGAAPGVDAAGGGNALDMDSNAAASSSGGESDGEFSGGRKTSGAGGPGSMDSGGANSAAAGGGPGSMDTGAKKPKSPSKEADISFTRNKYKMFVSFDLPEGDMFNAKGVDASQCIKLCNKDKTCTAVTYDRWNRYCFAKNAARSNGRLYVQAKSDTYILEREVRNISSSSSKIEIKRRRGKGFTGTPDYTASSVSYDTCKRMCGQDNKCVAFNHINSRRSCEFFFQPPEYFSKSGYQIGVKQQVR